MEGPSVAPGDDVEVSRRPIEAASLAEAVADPAAGAIVIFMGSVRDHAEDRTGITHLEYEAYGGVVEEKIAEIVKAARRQWPLQNVRVVHRLGSLEVGEISVGVGVSAEHRAEAFQAAEYLMDELKERAPIWKKEHWPGGAEWVRGGA